MEETKNDFKTMFSILWRNKTVFLSIIGAMVSISTGAAFVYNHFAKQQDVIQQYCERQAIDADTSLDIQMSRHEIMIVVSDTILDMFDNIDDESEVSKKWTKAWRTVKDKHNNALTRLTKQPKYWNPNIIRECIESPIPHIKVKGVLGTTINDDLLRGIQ